MIGKFHNPKITKKFGTDFHSSGGALTLESYEVTKSTATGQRGVHARTHDDGWHITGELHEDYYVWVTDFVAIHSKFGRVWGNFESEVYADSEEGFQDFYKNHPPCAWDYQDI